MSVVVFAKKKNKVATGNRANPGLMFRSGKVPLRRDVEQGLE